MSLTRHDGLGNKFKLKTTESAEEHTQHVIVDAGGGGGTQYTEGDTDATITGNAILWEDASDILRAVSVAKPLPVSDAGASLTVDGTVTVQDGGNVISVDDAGASLSVDDAGGSLTVDNGGTFAVQENGAALVALQLIDNLVLAEDVVAGNGDPGIQSLAVRKATPANLSGTDGDYEPLQINAGRLWTSATIDAALPAGANNIGDVDVVTVPAPLSITGGGTEVTALRVTLASDSTGLISVDDNGGSLTVDGTVTASNATGNVAHDAADSGNPVKFGGKALTTNPTAVADADRVDARFDDLGRQVVVLNHVRDLVTQSTITLSSTTETTLLAAGAAGVFHDLTLLIVTNSSATAVRVDFRDATGGTVRFSLAIAANGGAVVPFAVPWTQTAAANNWTAQLSAAVTDVRIAVQAVKNV